MKTYINSKIFLLGSLFLLAGCQSDEDVEIIDADENWQPVVSMEGLESNLLKMAVVQTGTNQYSQKWDEGDCFMATDNYTADHYTDKTHYISMSLHRKAEFTLQSSGTFSKTSGTMTKPSSNTIPVHEVYGYYPSKHFVAKGIGKIASTKYSTSASIIYLPTEQKYVSGKQLESGVFPMYCSTTSTSFNFKNIEGIVCVQLKAADNIKVKSITFTNSERYLSGYALVSLYNNGIPYLTFFDEATDIATNTKIIENEYGEWEGVASYSCPKGSNKVSLVVPDGKLVKPGTVEKFHVVLPPNTYPAGSMKLTIETDKFTCQYNVPKQWIVKRSSANTYTKNLIVSLSKAGVEGVEGDFTE